MHIARRHLFKFKTARLVIHGVVEVHVWVHFRVPFVTAVSEFLSVCMYVCILFTSSEKESRTCICEIR